MLRFWSCLVLKNLVQCIVVFYFGLKIYFGIELAKCIVTLERFDFHKKNCRTRGLEFDVAAFI